MTVMALDGVHTRDRAQNIVGATIQRVLANLLALDKAMTTPPLATRLGKIGSAGIDAVSLAASKGMAEITSILMHSLHLSY